MAETLHFINLFAPFIAAVYTLICSSETLRADRKPMVFLKAYFSIQKVSKPENQDFG